MAGSFLSQKTWIAGDRIEPPAARIGKLQARTRLPAASNSAIDPQRPAHQLAASPIHAAIWANRH
jgi:hypothetical protein